MAKKRSVEDKIDALTTIVEKGFAAVAGDIASINERMDKLATKDQVIALHTQVNSIETQLRGMKHVKLQSRVADLEEKVFGETRA
jgi:ABC-type phosphate transport system auxiliary subunit